MLTKDQQQNIAWHSIELDQEELVTISSKHLSDSGTAFCIYPVRESELFENLTAKQDLHLCYKLNIKNRKHDSAFRIVTGFGKKNVNIREEQLIIRKDDEAYTQQFKMLLKDFYLAF